MNDAFRPKTQQASDVVYHTLFLDPVSLKPLSSSRKFRFKFQRSFPLVVSFPLVCGGGVKNSSSPTRELHFHQLLLCVWFILPKSLPPAPRYVCGGWFEGRAESEGGGQGRNNNSNLFGFSPAKRFSPSTIATYAQGVQELSCCSSSQNVTNSCVPMHHLLLDLSICKLSEPASLSRVGEPCRRGHSRTCRRQHEKKHLLFYPRVSLSLSPRGGKLRLFDPRREAVEGHMNWVSNCVVCVL